MTYEWHTQPKLYVETTSEPEVNSSSPIFLLVIDILIVNNFCSYFYYITLFNFDLFHFTDHLTQFYR